jgi:hypothetical protein
MMSDTMFMIQSIMNILLFQKEHPLPTSQCLSTCGPHQNIARSGAVKANPIVKAKEIYNATRCFDQPTGNIAKYIVKMLNLRKYSDVS